MTSDAAEAIHERFVASLRDGKLPGRPTGVQPEEVGLGREAMVELF